MSKTEKKTTKKKAKKQENIKFLAKNIEEAVQKIIEYSNEKKRKFVESVDLSINLNIDAKQSDQGVRGSVLLPNGSGKKVRVVAFVANENKKKEAIDAGAVFAGLEDLVAKIEGGFLDFDYCVATPDVMSKIGKVAKILGPRGYMPSPKNGSVTADIKKAVEEALKGKVNFKNDKAGIVHCLTGKVDFSVENLAANVKEVLKVIKDAKPEGAKGKFIKKVHLSSTMGASVEIASEAF
jgi:large subunit ribosomal protein L1